MVDVLCLSLRGWCLMVLMAGIEVASSNSLSSVHKFVASRLSAPCPRLSSRHIKRLKLPAICLAWSPCNWCRGARKRFHDGNLACNSLARRPMCLEPIHRRSIARSNVERMTQTLRQSRSATRDLHSPGAALALRRSIACQMADVPVTGTPGTGCWAGPQMAFAAFQVVPSWLEGLAFVLRLTISP